MKGIGYGMLMLSLYIGIYYNILISWSFFYLFSSFTSSLPWASCDNTWNTGDCGRVMDRNCSLAGGLIRDGMCVQPHDVSEAEWDLLNQTANNAKMPSDEFFHNFMLEISEGVDDITGMRWELAGCLLLAWIIVYCALWKGIKSIGKVNLDTVTSRITHHSSQTSKWSKCNCLQLVYFTALFPYVILIILLIRAATLPGQ